jgi:hypothetical protein
MPKTLSDWFDFYLSGPTVRHISICLVKRHGANRPWYTGTCTFVLDSRLNYIPIQVFHIQFGQETIFSLSICQTVSLKVDLSCNSLFISLNKRFLWRTSLDHCVILIRTYIVFNEEYELYQPKETYEYIFSKYK